MKEQGLSKALLARLAAATQRGDRIVSGDKAWERQLRAWGIRAEELRRIVTEGALVGTLIHFEMYLDQPLVSDDAGQFQILGFLHGLCWLHAERVGPPLPRHFYQPEEDLPEAGCFLLAVPSGSHTRTA